MTHKGLLTTAVLTAILSGITGCSHKLQPKGFAVAPAESQHEEKNDGLSGDSLTFETRPGAILLTGFPQYRLVTIYKVNYRKDKSAFIGSNSFHTTYEEAEATNGNQWNNHIVPGFEAVFGYNMVNVSHYDTTLRNQHLFFDRSVLVKTVYYPSYDTDTLNYKPVKRHHYLVSAYDEDTNKDGFINTKDLRRFYAFDIHAAHRKPVIPVDYSVYKSEYDPANDFLYIFARHDDNKNGQVEEHEPVSIFWVDLNDPERTGKKY